MDVLELMKADHDEAAEIIDELESLADSLDADDAAHAYLLVKKLGQLMFLHTKAEETAVYEACKDKTQKVREFALQGYQEHALLIEVLQKLSTRTPGEDGEFKACLMVAKELFEHHARVEEEKGVFPKLRRAFNAAARDAMAQRMLAEKRRLLETGVVEAGAIEAQGAPPAP